VRDYDDASKRFSVNAVLSPAPRDPTWAQSFGTDYPGPAWPDKLERPQLLSSEIKFRVTQDDLAAYRDALVDRVSRASEHYLKVVLPERQARDHKREHDAVERERLIEEANCLLNDSPGKAEGDGHADPPA
jgi:hypothetical protein